MKKSLLFLSAVSFCLIAGAAQADDKVIVVSSSAEKNVEPNMVSLNVEIWSKASTAKQAQSLNASEFQKVKKSLDSFKVKKEDVQTENYSLNPEYIYDQKTQQNKMVGFRALQTLKVILKKTEDLGSFLDAMVTSATKNESGVNVNSIQWDTDKRQQFEISALGDAVKNGRAKADELAKAANVKIKGVSMLSHGVSHSAPPMPMRGMMKTMAYEMKPMDSTEVMAGQIKIRVDVTAEYEITN
ncbi:SIMPL domain-containing protein [Bdellovibrio sp. HCB337]|uniref:SIMPL domain-containing protein n=1 Tax=Bdellovibrio sp. HCB337 TaxID=3394358 RepID=UPI0039A54320